MKKQKSKIFSILLTLILIVLVVVSIMIFAKLNFWKNTNSKNIEANTQVNGIDISNLSRSDAYELINTYLKKKTDNFSLTLKHNDQIYILDKDDYEINNDISTIIDIAKNDSDYQSALKSLDYFTTHGNTTMVSFNYIFKGLDEKINAICENIEIPAIDSTITFNPNNKEMFAITPSQSGLKIDRAKLYEKINEQFQKTNSVLVELELEPAEPDIKEEDNQKLTNLISTFSTNVSDSTGNRKKNVKLALSKFNGMVINPGETISFNEVTAPHTQSNGYEIATIIYKGRFVDGVGGGICQASTTIYNALINAGISVDEVHKHTLPVRYVPLALDAMVSEGVADMKFSNNTDSPIFIKTFSTSDTVTVEIYSKPNDNGYTYKTRSETIKTLPALPDEIIADKDKEYTDKVIFKGETYRLTYAREGYEVISYLQTWQNNEIIKEEKLRHEVYQPQPGIIIEGVEDPIADMPIIQETTKPDLDDNFLLTTIPSNICP